MHRPDIFMEPIGITEITKQERGPVLTEFPLSEPPTIAMTPVARPHKWRSLLWEGLIVAFFLALAFVVRYFAALYAGLEVDEPIYRDAAEFLLKLGYPSIRPAYLHPTIPFLYHPPFYFYVLASWFYLWGSTSYFTARMLSVTLSLIALLFLYLFMRQVFDKKRALLVLALVGGDLWTIFTNQAIYIENSQMILVILAMWVYWRVSTSSPSSPARYLGWYTLAGLLIGCAIIYKQIGGFLAVVVALHLLLQRKHWIGHSMLVGMVVLTVLSYVLLMHLTFGELFDSATLDQIHRTLGAKAAPGLNTNAQTAIYVIGNRYWVFMITVVGLLGGGILSLIRYLQALLRRRDSAQPVLICWALGGVLFAFGISLKSPHYMILWIVPIYIFLAQEMTELFWDWRSQVQKLRITQHLLIQALGLLVCVLFLIANAFGYQGRFGTLPGDPLPEAAAYVNQNIPPNAVVLAKNYIGVDLVPPFLDIDLIKTPQEISRHRVSYMVLYWSTSAPLPASLGPVSRYCVPMKEFDGFKDHIQVCKIDPAVLATLVQK
jgi:4-amino-4-deoxy-L-arabinose transferase-like glycosyltransferase